jgi:sortase A
MGRVLKTLGVMMMVAGVGLIAMFFVGPPGGTSGSIPATDNLASSTDAGGPSDTTLYLTVPKIGLEDAKVYDSLSEEKLEESAIHVPGTGFPWQPGANTYIAGHRLGYFGTGSFLIFSRLNELEQGDEIIVEDSAGQEYVYRVTEQMVVGPEDMRVTEPVPGRSVVSLQTCTLPDFSERLVVRGDLVS